MRDCGQSLFIMKYHQLPFTSAHLASSQGFNEKVLSILDIFQTFSLSTTKYPPKSCRTFDSTSARVLLVKDALSLPPDFRATEKYCVLPCQLESVPFVSELCLELPLAPIRVRHCCCGWVSMYLILCASTSSTMPLLSLCCSRLDFQFTSDAE